MPGIGSGHGEQTPCRFRRAVRRRAIGVGRAVRPRLAQESARLLSDVAEGSRPRLSRIRSSRSPCSPVAASVHLPAAPLPNSGRSGARRGCVPACWRRRRPASSGRGGGRWRDSAGTPPRPRARDAVPVRPLARAWHCARSAAARSWRRSSLYRSSNAAMMSGPRSPAGTNSRSRQAMISLERPSPSAGRPRRRRNPAARRARRPSPSTRRI